MLRPSPYSPSTTPSFPPPRRLAAGAGRRRVPAPPPVQGLGGSLVLRRTERWGSPSGTGQVNAREARHPTFLPDVSAPAFLFLSLTPQRPRRARRHWELGHGRPAGWRAAAGRVPPAAPATARKRARLVKSVTVPVGIGG